MNPKEFERKMREGECFHSLRLLPNTWAVIRVDGRSFSQFTAARFEKPFDERFRDHMLAAARALISELNGVYCYTESDEISLLLPPNWSLFDRELEKTVSISAAIATSTFTLSCGEAAQFDSRVWLGATTVDVIDYFNWRQFDATRCCLNGWVYWTLRGAGMDYSEASKVLEGKSSAWKNEKLFEFGINFNNLPVWQKRGMGLYWKDREIIGVNPITGEQAPALRRYVYENMELPMKEGYSQFLADLLQVR
jgi:tRNA(His) guanylyltransferase